jgi:hypothetical protein
MTANELVSLLGQGLTATDNVEQFRSVIWHSRTGDHPAHLDVEVRDGSKFIITVNEVH